MKERMSGQVPTLPQGRGQTLAFAQTEHQMSSVPEDRWTEPAQIRRKRMPNTTALQRISFKTFSLSKTFVRSLPVSSNNLVPGLNSRGAAEKVQRIRSRRMSGHALGRPSHEDRKSA